MNTKLPFNRYWICGLVYLIACAPSTTPNPQSEVPRVEMHSPAISADLAITTAVNNFSATDNGFLLSHPKHQVEFSPDGILFKPRRSDLTLRYTFAGAFSGESSIAGISVGNITPKQTSNLIVEYPRGMITEQYVSRKNTVEQQFVIAQAPSLNGPTFELHGVISSNGTFSEETKNEKHHWIWKDGKKAIRLGDVTVIAADGKELPAQMEVSKDVVRIVLAASDLAAASYPVLIDPEFGTNDFRISDMGPNGNANYWAQTPAIAYNATANEYLVVWSADDSSGSLVDEEREIFGQRIDADTGLEVGTNDFRISDMGPNGDTNYAALSPAVAYSSSNNTYLVVWSGDDNTAPLVDNEFEIFGQRLSATGAEIGTNDFRISDLGTNGDTDFGASFPAVAYNSDDLEFLIVWQGDDDTGALVDGELEIFGQRINAITGATVGTNDFRISQMGGDGDANDDAIRPAVAYSTDAGEYLVVWEGDEFSLFVTVDEEFEIYGQRIDGATGAEVGTSDFRISDMGPSNDDAYDATQAAIAFSSLSDEYLVVWVGDDNTAPLVDEEFEIFGQRITTAGAQVGTNDFRISDMGTDGLTNAEASRPRVVYNIISDEYAVIWYGDDDSVEDEVHLQRLSGQTAAEVGTNDLRISDMGTENNANFFGAFPDIAYSSDENQYLITWYGDDNTAPLVDNEYEIFGQFADFAVPATPAAPDLTAATDLGSSNSDNLTSDSTPAVSGTAEADSTVTVTSSIAGVVGSGTATGGAYDITLNALAEGNHNLTVTATDEATNVSANSPALAITIDTTVAAPTLVSPISGFTTGDTTPTITGTAEALSTVTVLRATNVSLGSTATDGSGNWSFTTPQLADGAYTIYARAVDVAGNQSGDAVANLITIDTTDTDGDGTPNPEDIDDDGDGVTDAQEAVDGTDPLDDSSVVEVLGTSFCAEWNGFLDLWNIAEFVNVTSDARNVTSTLYDITGVTQGAVTSPVLPGAQTDVLVHDMEGFTANSYGKVCSSIESASPGDVDGRMVHYRNTANGIEFAFSMAFNNGLSGPVFVPFNTFEPSLDPVDASNAVANWITVSNLDNSNAQSGTIYYYGQDGSTLGSEAATIDAGGRRDFAGHQFGANLVGVTEWRPDDDSALFQVRNIRYLYNDPVATATGFDGAFQLEAIKGSNQTLYLPLDTRAGSSIIEVGNTLSSEVTFDLTLFGPTGSSLLTVSSTLAGHGSVHIITDSLLPQTIGSARIAAQGSGKIIATVMQYGRTASAGINYLYGIHAKEPLGTVMRGSYNNFLSQGCRLILVNTESSAQDVAISMTRFDGTVVLNNQTISLPANGTVESDVCANDAADTLGVVTVQPDTANSVIANIIRYGSGDSYRFPTAVR